MVVIVLHCLRVVARLHSLRVFVVFLVQWLVFQVVRECCYRRQSSLCKIVSVRHEAVRENSLGKRVFVVRIHVLCGVHEIVFSALAKQRDELFH